MIDLHVPSLLASGPDFASWMLAVRDSEAKKRNAEYKAKYYQARKDDIEVIEIKQPQWNGLRRRQSN